MDAMHRTTDIPMLVGDAVLPPVNPVGAAEKKRSKKNANAGEENEAKMKYAGSRFKMMNAFVDATACSLSRAPFAVWVVLYREAYYDIACVGQESIAKRAGVNVRTVRRAIGTLKAKGLLDVIEKGRPGFRPNKYRIRPVSLN
jgi:Helix-turn-helix domain